MHDHALHRPSFRRAAICVALAALAACGPVPGGTLDGTVAPAPADWTAILPEQHRFCEIESRPEKPHSIQLDCFLYDDGLYVQSHRWALASWWPVRSWAAVWLDHPDVKVRIGETIYPLRAVPVTDPPARDAVLRFRGDEPPPAGIVVFRFEPRA